MKKAKFTEKDIRILTWREAIRKRPAMYVGSTGIQGFTHLLKEFFASFYRYVDVTQQTGDSPAINLEAEQSSFSITGKQSGIFLYNGLGYPIIGNISENLTLFGCDFAVLNALSQNYELSLFDKDKNELLKQVYNQGISQDGTIDEQEYFAKSLQIKFELDDSIWENFSINPIFTSDIIKDLAFLNKDKTFEIKYLVNTESCRVVYHFKDGLRDMIESQKPSGWGSTIFDTYIEKDFENFSVETAFAFWNYSVNEPFFKSFVNNHHTHENGTHADALISGIIRASRDYVEKHHTTERFVITKRTVLSFLLAGVHVKMKKPHFCGSTKDKLDSKEILKPLSDYIAQLLFEKFESDHEKTKDIIRHFYEIHWNKNWLKHLDI